MITALYPPELARIEGFPAGALCGAGGMINVSAQAAFDPQMNILGHDDLAVQTRACIENIGHVLMEAGVSLCDVANSIAYVVDLDDQKTQAYRAAMGEAINSGSICPHATTLVGVTRLPHPDMMIEISAVAIRS